MGPWSEDLYSPFHPHCFVGIWKYDLPLVGFRDFVDRCTPQHIYIYHMIHRCTEMYWIILHSLLTSLAIPWHVVLIWANLFLENFTKLLHCLHRYRDKAIEPCKLLRVSQGVGWNMARRHVLGRLWPNAVLVPPWPCLKIFEFRLDERNKNPIEKIAKLL